MKQRMLAMGSGGDSKSVTMVGDVTTSNSAASYIYNLLALTGLSGFTKVDVEYSYTPIGSKTYSNASITFNSTQIANNTSPTTAQHNEVISTGATAVSHATISFTIDGDTLSRCYVQLKATETTVTVHSITFS